MKKRAITYLPFLFVILTGMVLISCNESDAKNNFGFNWGDQETRTSPEGIENILSRLSGGSLISKENVKAFYREREYTPTWTDEETATELYTRLDEAGKEGLRPKDYHLEEINKLLRSKSRSEKESSRLDILLTDAFMTYSRHLFYGKLDPAKLHRYYGVKREEKDLAAHLEKALEKGDISGALEDLKPPHQVYRDLKAALEEYTALKEKDTSFTTVKAGKLVRPGEKDSRIPEVADRLKELGFLHPIHEIKENLYDRELEKAVREFQERKRLKVDGILGNATYEELNKKPENRHKQILANLERWRWYPRDLGDHYILVNIPDYKLAVVKNGDTLRTHNVIAGRKSRPTPIFSETLQHIVLNPEWTIPPTIKTRDVIPAASRNPSYLRNNNMVVTNSSGERIDPSGIDWSDPRVKNYTFTQRAGPSNPLGRVKIIYPNRFLVYLHDTPAKSLFAQNERAESSGCVRVEDALDLSAYVVDNQPEWDQARINEILAGGKTTHVKITQPIQVHHFYWTAWKDNGKTVFTDDVYELDKKIWTALLAN